MIMNKILRYVYATVLLIVMGCSSDSPVEDDENQIFITTIVINGSNITDGNTKQLSIAILPNNATNKVVTWSVSDESVALISDTGMLTPVDNGTVIVRVEAQDASGVSAEKAFNISGVTGPVVLVEEIIITGGVEITDGQPLQLSAEVLPANATSKVVVWSVSDTTIATVTSEGLLNPIKNGTVRVTASSIDGSNVKGEIDITISGIVVVNSTAENVLAWQKNNGGWSKEIANLDEYANLSESQVQEGINKKGSTNTTIDNEHTVGEIRILLNAYNGTGNPDYIEGAEKGIDYLMEAQYDNGGWPQYYPDFSSYRGRITYNDNAMVNVMNLMRDIFLKQNNLQLVNESYVSAAQTAFDKGIEVILDTQVTINGEKTAWCAQHHEVTLAPADARDYELASNSGSESVGIVRLLMSLDNPSSEVIDAVNKAVAWFEAVKIEGYALQDTGGDKVLVASPGNVIWARFYTLDNYTGHEYESLFNTFEPNEPFFCSRPSDSEGGGPRKTIAEISHERRNGYAWYGNWPNNLIGSEYTAWKNKHGI